MPDPGVKQTGKTSQEQDQAAAESYIQGAGYQQNPPEVHQYHDLKIPHDEWVRLWNAQVDPVTHQPYHFGEREQEQHRLDLMRKYDPFFGHEADRLHYVRAGLVNRPNTQLPVPEYPWIDPQIDTVRWATQDLKGWEDRYGPMYGVFQANFDGSVAPPDYKNAFQFPLAQIPQYKLGYTPTYWDDPKRVARWHDYLANMPEGVNPPDWIDKAQIDAAYAYLKDHNKGKPWTDWRFPDKNDPVRGYLAQMGTPPKEALLPPELLYTPQERTDLPPSDLEPPADAPWFVKAGNYLFGSGSPFGSALGGGLIGALGGVGIAGIATLATGGAAAPLLIGAGYGALLGAGLGGTQAVLSKQLQENPDLQKGSWQMTLFGLMQPLMAVFNLGWEGLKRGLVGMPLQIAGSLTNPERYGSINELFQNLPAAWQAAYGTAFAAPVDVLQPLEWTDPQSRAHPSSQLEDGTVWTIYSDKPVKIPEIAGISQGTALKSVSNWLDPIVWGRREIAAGTPAAAVQQIMAQRYGLTGQMRELIGGVLLDPGWHIYPHLATKGIGVIGEVMGNEALVGAATRAAELGGWKGPVNTLRLYALGLQTETPIEIVAAGNRLTRYLGGVERTGPVRVAPDELSAVGRIADLVDPTTRAPDPRTRSWQTLEANQGQAVVGDAYHVPEAVTGRPSEGGIVSRVDDSGHALDIVSDDYSHWIMRDGKTDTEVPLSADEAMGVRLAVEAARAATYDTPEQFVNRWLAGPEERVRIRQDSPDVAARLDEIYPNGIKPGTSWAPGTPTHLVQRTGLINHLAGLTPRSRAMKVLGIGADVLKALVDSRELPEDVTKVLKQIIETPTQVAEDLSLRFIGAPEGAYLIHALKDFDFEVLDNMLLTWKSSEIPRQLLGQLARVTGEHETAILEKLGDPKTRSAFFQDAMGRIRAKMETGDPTALILGQALDSGVLSETGLGDMFKLFETEGAPWHPEMWKAQLHDAMIDYVAQWTIDHLGVKVEPLVWRLAKVSKAVHSLLLLDVNPGYAVNNFVNNMGTMIVDGAFRLRGIGDALKWWGEFGVYPFKLRQAFGGPSEIDALGVSEYAKVLNSQAAADMGLTGLRMKSEGEAIRKIADAAQGKGGTRVAVDWITNVRRKVGIASRASAKIEEWSSIQATTRGTQTFWARAWRRGKGFRRMPGHIEEALGPELSNIVYSLVEGSLSMDQVKSALTKGQQLRYSLAATVNDAARALGMDAQDVNDMLTSSGAKDFLDPLLAKAKSPADVREAFSAMRAHVQAHLDHLAVEENVTRMLETAAQVQTGDWTSFLDTWNELQRNYDEWWTGHILKQNAAMDEIYTISDQDLANQVAAARRFEANTEAGRMKRREMATIKGIEEGLRRLGVDFPEGYTADLTQQHSVLDEFFAHKDKTWADFWQKTASGELPFKSQEWIAEYVARSQEIERRYGQVMLERDHLQAGMDAGIVEMVSAQDPKMGDRLGVMLGDLREFRLVMAQQEADVRRLQTQFRIKGALTGQAAAKAIRSHFKKEPEFIQRIEPWLADLETVSKIDSHDLNTRLYREYTENMKIPAIAEEAKIRDDGLKDMLASRQPEPRGDAQEFANIQPAHLDRTRVQELVDQKWGIGEAKDQAAREAENVKPGNIESRLAEADRLTAEQGGAAASQRSLLDIVKQRISPRDLERVGQTPGQYIHSFIDQATQMPALHDALGIPQGDHQAVMHFLDKAYEHFHPTEAKPDAGQAIEQLAQDQLGVLRQAANEADIPTATDSGAPADNHLINWINGRAGLSLRQEGTPIRRLEDLTPEQQQGVLERLKSEGDWLAQIRQTAKDVGMTYEAVKFLHTKQGSTAYSRRLAVQNGLHERLAEMMDRQEVFDWLWSRMEGRPYQYPEQNWMTPPLFVEEVLRPFYGDHAEADQMVDAHMTMLRLRAEGRGQSLEDFLALHYAKGDPDAQVALFQRYGVDHPHVQAALEHFGRTTDPVEGLYLLRDGTFLDGSGRSQGSQAVGHRVVDHREIGAAGYEYGEGYDLVVDDNGRQVHLGKFRTEAEADAALDPYLDAHPDVEEWTIKPDGVEHEWQRPGTEDMEGGTEGMFGFMRDTGSVRWSLLRNGGQDGAKHWLRVNLAGPISEDQLSQIVQNSIGNDVSIVVWPRQAGDRAGSVELWGIYDERALKEIQVRNADAQSISEALADVERIHGITRYQQPEQVAQDPNFKQWFAGSQVTDDKGLPKMMYHGTGTPGFSEFDLAKTDPNALYYDGFYFTDDPSVAGGVYREILRWTFHDTEAEANAQVDLAHWVWQDEATGKWIAPVRDYEVVRRGYAHKGRDVRDLPPEVAKRVTARLRESERYRHLMDPRDNTLTVDQKQTMNNIIDAFEEHGQARALRVLESGDYLLTVQTALEQGGGDAPGAVYPVYLNVRNPLDLDAVPAPEEITGFINAVRSHQSVGNLDWLQRAANDLEQQLLSMGGGQNYDDLFYELHKSLAATYHQDVFHTDPAITGMAKDILQGMGFDGLTHEGGKISGGTRHRVYIAWDPAQVKSAHNTGTWDPNVTDIRYQQGRPDLANSDPAPIFYSRLERVIDEKMQDTMPAQDALNWLHKQGLKADELAWTGIDDILTGRAAAGETVTKQQVLKWVRDGQVTLTPVVRPTVSWERVNSREPLPPGIEWVPRERLTAEQRRTSEAFTDVTQNNLYAMAPARGMSAWYYVVPPERGPMNVRLGQTTGRGEWIRLDLNNLRAEDLPPTVAENPIALLYTKRGMADMADQPISVQMARFGQVEYFKNTLDMAAWFNSAEHQARMSPEVAGQIQPTTNVAGNPRYAAYYYRRFIDTFNTLEDAQRAVSRGEDLARVDAQYETYTLPGGTDYQEHLLTLPRYKSQEKIAADTRQILERVGRPRGMTADQIDAISQKVAEGWDVYEAMKAEMGSMNGPIAREVVHVLNGADEYSSPHFDVANIVAHTRTKRRTTVDGQPTFFVEEVQSDWHQAGREQGYTGGGVARADLAARREVANQAVVHAYRLANETLPEGLKFDADNTVLGILDGEGGSHPVVVVDRTPPVGLDVRGQQILGDTPILRSPDSGEVMAFFPDDASLAKFLETGAITKPGEPQSQPGGTAFVREGPDDPMHITNPLTGEVYGTVVEGMGTALRQHSGWNSVVGNPYEITPEQMQLARDWRLRQSEVRMLSDQEHVQGIPDAPWKKDWHELTLRYAIRQAVEAGKDSITWTTGREQAQRYGLGSRFDHMDAIAKTHRLTLNPGSANAPRTLDVNWTTYHALPDRPNVSWDTAVERGWLVPLDQPEYLVGGYDSNGNSVWSRNFTDPKEMAAYIGQDLADRIVAETSDGKIRAKYEGEDLLVGTEGMSKFYDEILPRYAAKVGKKFGATVDRTQVETGRGTRLWVLYSVHGDAQYFLREQDAIAVAETDPGRYGWGSDRIYPLRPSEALAPITVRNLQWEYEPGGLTHEPRIVADWDGLSSGDTIYSAPNEADVLALVQDLKVNPQEYADVTYAPAHRLNISPEMKRSVLYDGQRLFQMPADDALTTRRTAAIDQLRSLGVDPEYVMQTRDFKDLPADARAAALELIDANDSYAYFNRTGQHYTFGMQVNWLRRVLGRDFKVEVKRVDAQMPAFGEGTQQVYRLVEPDSGLVLHQFTDQTTASIAADFINRGETPQQGPAPAFEPKGMYARTANGQAIVKALKNPDFSTGVHEMAHEMLFNLERQDKTVALRWYRETHGGEVDLLSDGTIMGPDIEDFDEKFARGFEQYLAEGNAPFPELRALFAKMKKWMLEVYHSIRGTSIDVGINNEMRDLFSRELSGDPAKRQQIGAYFNDVRPVPVEEPVAPVTRSANGQDYTPEPSLDRQLWDLNQAVENVDTSLFDQPGRVSENQLVDLSPLEEQLQSLKQQAGDIGEPASDLTLKIDDKLAKIEAARRALQEADPRLYGAGTSAHGPDPNVNYQFRYRIASMDDLVPSHTLDGMRNRKFPSELQPRQRDRAASQQWISETAAHLAPEALINQSSRIDDGSPIVGKDLIVESGNGRALAMDTARQEHPDRWNAYQDYLKQHVEDFGIDPAVLATVKDPVLVRERTDSTDRLSFVREANGQVVASMSGVELAASDANKINPEILAGFRISENQSLEEAIRAAGNRGFVRSFVSGLPRNDQGAMADARGNLSRLGVQRIKAALLAAFFKSSESGPGQQMVNLALEAVDVNVKRVVNGIESALPELAKADALITAGRRPGELAISDDLAAATLRLRKMRDEGQHIDDVLQQTDMFGGLTDFQKRLLEFFVVPEKTPDGNQPSYVSTKKIREVLQEYGRRVIALPDTGQTGLFGDVQYPTKAELFETSSRGSAENRWQLPEQAQGGAINQVPAEQKMAAIQQEAWDNIEPVLQQAERRLADNKAFGQQWARPDLDRRLSPEMQRQFQGWLNGLRGDMASTKHTAMRWGEKVRDWALLDYTSRRGLDNYAEAVMPYYFWPTATMIRWSLRAIDRPALIGNYYRFLQTQGMYQAPPGYPSRLKGKVKIPMPFLPEWMGGALYADPLRSWFPPAMFAGEFGQVAQQQYREQQSAAYQVQRWYGDGTISEKDARDALNTRTGPVWDRAIQQAKADSSSDVRGLMDYLGILSSFSLPITWGKEFARGTPENIRELPVTRTVRTLTAAAPQVFGTGGINLEAPVRDALNIPQVDQYEEYRAERMVSNMVAEGLVTPDQASQVFATHQGPIWEQARQRVDQARFRGSFANPLYWIGFPADSYPTGERAQRQLAGEWQRALDHYTKGDDKALQTFLDKYPEYESRLNLNKDPNERLRYMLVDEVWTRYMDLGSADKELVRNQLGEDFQTSFLDKPPAGESRDYAAIPIQKLADWAQQLGYRLPPIAERNNGYTVPKLNSIQPDQRVKILHPDISQAVDTYRTARNHDHPNWYAVQQQYFKQPYGQRSAWIKNTELGRELQSYWNWDDQYKKDHPIIQVYSQRFTVQGPDGEDLASWSVPEVLSNPTLLRQLISYRVGGIPLTNGALLELERIWERMGYPGANMDHFVNSLALQ